MKVRVIITRRASASLQQLRQERGHAPAVFIRRQERPYWATCWHKQGNEYTGTYQTPYGAFMGFIRQRSSTELDFYLYKPPEALQEHSHWSCFQQHTEDGWYFVHMAERPRDVSAGILTIERLLSEALEG